MREVVVSEETYRKLIELRKVLGKESIAEVIDWVVDIAYRTLVTGEGVGSVPSE